MKKLFLTMALAAIVFTANAAVINETTDPIIGSQFVDVGDAHWDTNTNLDWLDFGTLVGQPMTFGHSINSANAAYNPQGWRIATEGEVHGLFNMFFAPEYVGTNGTMNVPEGDGQSALIMARNSWLFSFGTDAVSTTTNVLTIENTGLASLGLFLDGTGNVDFLGVTIDTNPLTTTIYGPEYAARASWDLDTAGTNLGVFMVRDHVVPIPAAIWLFGSGLLGLVAVARRRV